MTSWDKNGLFRVCFSVDWPCLCLLMPLANEPPSLTDSSAGWSGPWHGWAGYTTAVVLMASCCHNPSGCSKYIPFLLTICYLSTSVRRPCLQFLLLERAGWSQRLVPKAGRWRQQASVWGNCLAASRICHPANVFNSSFVILIKICFINVSLHFLSFQSLCLLLLARPLYGQSPLCRIWRWRHQNNCVLWGLHRGFFYHCTAGLMWKWN